MAEDLDDSATKTHLHSVYTPPPTVHMPVIVCWIAVGALGFAGVIAVTSSAGAMDHRGTYAAGLAAFIGVIIGTFGTLMLHRLYRIEGLMLSQREHFDTRLCHSKIRQGEIITLLCELLGIQEPPGDELDRRRRKN